MRTKIPNNERYITLNFDYVETLYTNPKFKVRLQSVECS